MNCRFCNQPITRPDLTPEPDIHGACYIMEDKHFHENLDKYGYCIECNVRVMTHFKGFPLPDRPMTQT